MESRDVRAKYKALADEVKQALFEKHPDYQYRPRRPSEKRRRARRNPQAEEEEVDEEPSPGFSEVQAAITNGSMVYSTAELQD
jgi:hypothetical protein